MKRNIFVFNLQIIIYSSAVADDAVGALVLDPVQTEISLFLMLCPW